MCPFKYWPNHSLVYFKISIFRGKLCGPRDSSNGQLGWPTPWNLYSELFEKLCFIYVSILKNNGKRKTKIKNPSLQNTEKQTALHTTPSVYQLWIRTILFNKQWEHNKHAPHEYLSFDWPHTTDTKILFTQKVILYTDRSQVKIEGWMKSHRAPLKWVSNHFKIQDGGGDALLTHSSFLDPLKKCFCMTPDVTVFPFLVTRADVWKTTSC